MTKLFKKAKNPYFSSLFLQIWAKTSFSQKLGAVCFGDCKLLGPMQEIKKSDVRISIKAVN